MCLIVFSFQPGSPLPLALAANRDEFHDRPTRGAGFLPEHPPVLAGLDLRAGGTWLGLDRRGRFAAITNFRDPDRTVPGERSRGEPVLDYLTGGAAPGGFLHGLAQRGDQYAGFNLLAGDSRELWYLSNCPLPDGTPVGPRPLQPGLYGLSNAYLDTPWPKVTAGRERLAAALRADAPDHESLAATVADRQPAEPAALHVQGLTTDMERRLSAQFILTPEYGTRSCTTLWLRDNGTCCFRELGFDPRGQVTRRRSFVFRRPGRE